MKKITIDENKKCPECGRTDGQHCKRTYTLEPKHREYSEETKKQALKIYYAGASGRTVGKILGMSKANVYNWIKKNTEK